MNELIINPGAITVEGNIVNFENYEKLKAQALIIKEVLQSAEVSEENIKEAKKLVAQVRKASDQLNAEKVRVKKEILKSYNEFENQVKEIRAIVDEADGYVRNQIKQLEEKARSEKEELIKELYDKHMSMYNFKDCAPFDEFMTVQYLNKTYPISKVEEKITEYLEQIQKDIETITILPDSDKVLAEYLTCKNLTEAIQRAEQLKEQERKAEEVAKSMELEKREEKEEKEENKKDAIIKISFDDLMKVENFMLKNNIDYTIL